MSNWLARTLNTLTVGRPQRVGPTYKVIGPRPGAVVKAPPRFAWDEKRWTQRDVGDSIEFVGTYRVYDRAARKWRQFHGVIRQQAGNFYTYIADPPPEVKEHRHGACLQLANAPWFRLHWNQPPASADAALIYMERMLDESLNRR